MTQLDYIEGFAIGAATGAGMLSWLGVLGPLWALGGMMLLVVVVVGETLWSES